jgi:leucyl-tRNA synthetase
MSRYNPASIEPKWQQFWEKNNTFATPDLPTGKQGEAGEKLYVLDMFPYPSGSGLHVGHPEGYTATDIVCRYARMKGKTVLHPMGFDSFGLPAEEYAIKTNTPPRVSTEKNIAEFTRQLKMLGFSYDWNRVIATTDVEYFRWTQWIFLVVYDTWFDTEQQKGRPISELPIPADVQSAGADAIREYQDDHRLAYQSDALVNWCPKLGTVLANEEVIDGRSERGNHPVERIPLRQWMLRITAYGERLEKDLATLDWSTGVKKKQHDWIGRSLGAEVDFFIGEENQFSDWQASREDNGFPRKLGDDVLRVYTTRPDTLYGATYMVLAPEHPFVPRLTTKEQKAEIEAYCQAAAGKSDRDRQDASKAKTGALTGSYATNPVNGEAIPIWIADYVLSGYGTGAIMAVPAHDERDFEFATKFDIPIRAVVDPGDQISAEDREQVLAGKLCFAGTGVAINDGDFDGMPTAEFKEKMTTDLTGRGLGKAAVNYKLRDWLFARQRFWGEPFPILHELDAHGKVTGAVRACDPEDLPIDLPELDDYQPHGKPEPPLGKSPDEWLFVEKDGKWYRRETNTMPQWAGSCWYYLRFIDPRNDKAFVDPEKEKAWMPVDLYIGGAEHAVLHLLYARFWHKVLFDRGYVSTPEPFQKLINQGMILGENNEKMSKSRGNVVNPDDVVKDYGADSLRLYEMFMGPLEATKPWSMQGVSGVRGFLDRAWRMIVDRSVEDAVQLDPAVQDAEPTEDQNRVLHKTIQAITANVENLSGNTAIARMMEFTNFFTKENVRPKAAMEKFVLLLSPFAPHIAEELWQILGHDTTLAYEPWPDFDPELARDSEIEIPVQIKGKVKHKIFVPNGLSKDDLQAAVEADAKVQEILADKEVVKVIVVPGRLVNFVTK